MSKKRKPTSGVGSGAGSLSLSKTNVGASGLVLAVLVALFGFMLYANTLGHEYVLDDVLAISAHPNVQRGIAGIVDIFSQPYREGCFGGCLYRPMTLTTFAIEWAIAPKSTFIGHFFNVLWFSATSALLFITLLKILPQRYYIFSLTAALLFVSHPVHTEVVANIKSRDEILSLFFLILCMYQFVGWHKTGNWKSILFAALAFLAAMLSKEGAVTAFIIFPLAGWTFFQKSLIDSIKNSAWMLASMGIFFILRGSALSGLTEPAISMMDNPLIDAGTMERFGTSLVVLGKYFMLLILPYQQISDYSYNVVPVQTFENIGSLAGLLLYGGLTIYAVYAVWKRSLFGFVVTAFLFSLALYSQIPKLIGTLMAERLLFTPSLWFVLGLTSLLAVLVGYERNTLSISQKSKGTSGDRKLLIVSACIIILYSFQTVKRNNDWESNLKLYQADVVKAPNSVRLNDGYAEELYKSSFDASLSSEEIDQILTTSEQYSQKSLSIKPGVSAYNNLGNIYFTRKKFAEAITYHQKTLEILPGYTTAKRNITYVLIVWARQEGEKNNNPVRARELLYQALEYEENSSDVWHLIGVSYAVQSNFSEALTAFEKAYSLAPSNADIKRDLSKTYEAMGMQDKADALK